ncbi:phosphoribosylformylglycinamidine synthase [Candidatus Parcubacteria bacterium]|nr:phosphoribosylformylglycinamidine synthase [Candidatus Parcubacteria bacterium]
MYHFYHKISDELEYCFNVEVSKKLTQSQKFVLKQILSDGFLSDSVKTKSSLDFKNKKIIEIGPRLNFATAFSTNAVSICHVAGLKNVLRIEKSKRYAISLQSDSSEFIKKNYDRMTESHYLKPLEKFRTNIKPKKVYTIPLLKDGISAIKKINKEMGLGMDEWDEKFYYDLFAKDLKRDPTNVECFQLGQANSEHSRHWFFNGKLIIDKKEIPETLFDIVRAPIGANKENSIIAFKDNSSAIKGNEIITIIPEAPGKASALKKEKLNYDITFTAETHNFPSGVAPFPGAETGTGGRIRDGQATGKGSLIVAGTAGYCVGNLNIPKYKLPWEDKNFTYPNNLASPLKIEIQASNGASDYGNKFGEPLIQGFTRSFGIRLPNKERREWLKPIMFTGGVGQINRRHTEKEAPQKGMIIIQIGGPAYRIGTGGGAASSMIQGENLAELDFNAVQRGDAEMEQKMNRVIRACVEMGKNNPIISIHDQGAGGPCNVLTELVEPAGGKVEIRNINVGDKTLSVLEIWGAEYQERNALLIKSSKIEKFDKMCKREKVKYERLGEITEDGRITVYDRKDNSFPVNLELSKILGKMPQKTFKDETQTSNLDNLKLPEKLNFKKALENVLRLVSVGSKRFLTTKVDRSVTGLIARQQCCGPLQLTVSDVAVIAQSHFGNTGAAIAIGEQPIKTLVNCEAGARMSVGEALTNLVWAKIEKLGNIKCSANWMLAAKLPGEGINLYYAAAAMRKIMIDLGIAVDGGKDSLSMAAKVGDEIVKSPNELTISAYADMADINKVITPDIKKPGKSELWLIDIGNNKNRLGGSALAHSLGQIGNESPDVDDSDVLKRSFCAIQQMIDEKIILSGHDRSDGGLITTILEMAFAGNCGVDISFKLSPDDILPYYFNEELGLVVEVDLNNRKKFTGIIKKHNLENITSLIAQTFANQKIKIVSGDNIILNENMLDLRQLWEETSHQLNKLQTEKKQAIEEKRNIYERKNPQYKIAFVPKQMPQKILEKKEKIKIAIIREEGSNGDREMSSAFYMAGFEPWDVTMSDLLNNKINLDDFRGIAFVGGFSYADVLGSAKGWASTIRFNDKLKNIFDAFYNRKNTFSLGVCNGCQLMSLLGWVPAKDVEDKKQPRFIKNNSARFESRWVTVKISQSPAIMLKNMENSVLGIWVAHGEGRLSFPNNQLLKNAIDKKLTPLSYVDDNGNSTEKYPFNPNGSPQGITALCSEDGRHLAMMPHPERTFLKWQWPWMPEKMKKELQASPWLKMFQNARKWCEKN